MEIIRNLGRHKLRNFLTIAGIVIGVLALTTMGSLAEKTNLLFEGGVTFYQDHVTVGDASSQFGGVMRLEKADELARVPGVAAVFPVVSVPAKSDLSISFGPPASIVGVKDGYDEWSKFELRFAHGRDLAPGASGETIIGSDLAKELRVSVGGTVRLPIPPKEGLAAVPSREFKVVGIIEKTLTAPDNFAYVSLADAQALLKDQLPPAFRGSVDPTKLASSMDVFGTPGTDLDALAKRINAEVRDVKAVGPTELVQAFQAGSAIFTAITTGSALLALIVGGLSIINTMSMAVIERFREIGLKKAVGARTGHILREFLFESAAIGVIGGVIGLALGWALIELINALTASSNLSLFLLTPRLVLIAAVFSIGLGGLAGLIPALRAARLDPVTALRYQ